MDNNEDFVRDPDSVVSEQLLGDNYDRELDEAIYASMQDTYQSIRSQVEYEEQILKDFDKTKELRTNEFKPLLSDLLRMSKFDKECKEIYDIIEPIIDAYCNQYIEYCDLDTTTYERIFGVLGTIRNCKKCVDELKKIIKQT